MATEYNTGNPTGSNDPRDLSDNAVDIDEWATSRSKYTHDDRLGFPRKTFYGIEQDAIAAIQNAGYVGTGVDGVVEDYAAGIEFTQYNQILRDPVEGEFWRISGTVALPYTTTGTGLPEGGAFVSVGDGALRQELSLEDGAELIGYQGGTVKAALDSRATNVGSISDLLALPTGVLLNGAQFSVRGYNAGTSIGGGTFYWDGASTETADDVNIFGTFTSGRFKRINRSLALDDAGADPTGETASDDALDRVLSALPVVSGTVRTKMSIELGHGRYVFNSGNHTTTQEQGIFLQFVGGGKAKTQVDYYGAETVFLDIPAEFVEVAGFTAINRTATRDKRFLRQRLTDNRADVDATFENILAVNWEYMHHCYGRGSVNINCTLQGGPWALIESPDPFVEGPEPNVQSVKTGMRRYVSSNLMVDSAVAVFEFSENGPAAEYINEVTINGVHGNTLSALVLGGYLNNVTIRTGALVRSLTLGAIRAKRIKNLDMDISAVRGYDPDATPADSTRINYLILLETDGAVSTSDVMLADAKISGVVGNLGSGLIQCRGKLGNITLSGLMHPNAFESSAVSGVQYITAFDGMADDSIIIINGVSFSGSVYDASTFSWTNSAIPDDAVKFGPYAPGNVPVPLEVSNRGTATIPDSSSQISFPHGLGFTPALEDIQITPMGNPNAKGTHWWVDAVSASNILIRTSSAGAGTLTFSWSVNRARG